jgi:hypothetical protein
MRDVFVLGIVSKWKIPELREHGLDFLVVVGQPLATREQYNFWNARSHTVRIPVEREIAVHSTFEVIGGNFCLQLTN